MWRQALRTTSLYRLPSCPSCISSLHSLRPPSQSSPPSLPNQRERNLCTPRPPPPHPPTPPSDPPSDEAAADDEFEDFTTILALDPAAAAAAAAAALAPHDVIDSLSTAPRDMTPAQADALVRALVSAADASISAGAAARGAPPPLTAHTVAVLRAARITTNFVNSAAADDRAYPIERKVVATLDLAELGCGRLERAAVEAICGARCKDGLVKVVGDRFGTREENVAWVVGVLGRIVKEARIAVGETVDDTVLGSWEEVVDAATSTVEGDTELVREMVQHVLNGDLDRNELGHGDGTAVLS